MSVISQLAAPLNIVTAQGSPFTLRVPLTLPDDVVLTDAELVVYAEDSPQPSMWIDADEAVIVAAWTAEQTAETVRRADSYALLVSLDDAPAVPLYAGRISWVEPGHAGASTTTTAPIVVHLGDVTVSTTVELAGAQGPGIEGVGISRIEKITQDAYDLLDPPSPSTFYVITT